MKMTLLRDALVKTDKFMKVADAEQDYDGGISYRQALQGVLVVLDLSRRERVYILRAFDRLERYRSYLRRRALDRIVLPDGRTLSAANVRDAFAAQRRMLDQMYSR